MEGGDETYVEVEGKERRDNGGNEEGGDVDIERVDATTRDVGRGLPGTGPPIRTVVSRGPQA